MMRPGGADANEWMNDGPGAGAVGKTANAKMKR